jgi:putative endonuclease
MLYYVYLIESFSAQGRRYVGMTADLKQRLLEQNAGKSRHTSNSGMRLTTYIAFTHRAKQKPLSVISNLGQATHSPGSAYGNTMAKT